MLVSSVLGKLSLNIYTFFFYLENAPSATHSLRKVMLLTAPVKSSFKKDLDSITAANIISIATNTGYWSSANAYSNSATKFHLFYILVLSKVLSSKPTSILVSKPTHPTRNSTI